MDQPLVAVLFDLDGTLVNSRDAILNSISHTLESNDYGPLKKEDHVLFHGVPLAEALKNWQPETKQMVHEFRSHYLETYMETTFVFPGIVELLEVLQRENVPIGIITLKTTHEANMVLEQMDLMRFFRGKVYGDDSLDGDCPYGIKPDPSHPLWSLMAMGIYSEEQLESLLRTCGGCGVDPAKAVETFGGSAVLVGDAGQDIETGKAAGMVSYGAAWGGRDIAVLMNARPDAIFKDPVQMITALGLKADDRPPLP